MTDPANTEKKTSPGEQVAASLVMLVIVVAGSLFMFRSCVQDDYERTSWAIGSAEKAFEEGHYEDALHWYDLAGTDPGEGGFRGLKFQAALGKAKTLLALNKGKEAEETLSTAYRGSLMREKNNYGTLVSLWSDALEKQGRGAEAGRLQNDLRIIETYGDGAGVESPTTGEKFAAAPGYWHMCFVDRDIGDLRYQMGQWPGTVSTYETAVEKSADFEKKVGSDRFIDPNDATAVQELIKVHERLAELYEKHYGGMPGYADKAAAQRSTAKILSEALNSRAPGNYSPGGNFGDAAGGQGYFQQENR